MTLVRIARPLEDVEALPETFEQALGCEQLRSCRRELDGEWEAIDSPTHLAHGGRLGDVRSNSTRAVEEQRDSLALRERRQVELHLASDAERLAGGDEQAH